MAWKDTLLNASYKGVTFHAVNTEDAAERALVRHEYPYRDGAEVEDLGRRARTVRVQAIFWGKDYESDLRKLLDALAKSGPGELVHPVFGSINVSLERHGIMHHAENPDSAMVHLDFVEAEPDAPFFAGGASAAAKALGNAGKLSTALDKLRSLNVSAVQGWASKASNTLSSVARGDLLGASRGVFSQAANLAGVSMPTMPDLSGMGQGGLLGSAQSLVSSIGKVASMPDVFGKFASLSNFSDLLPRYSLSADGQNTAYTMTPAAYSGTPVSGPLTGAAEARPVVVVPSTSQASQVTSPDLSTPSGQGRAMAAATLNLASAMAVATATSGVLAAEVQAPTLTPAEVEAAVGVSRQRLQDCIADQRALFPTYQAYPIIEELRTSALAVQDMGAQVIRLHPPLVVQTAPSSCNLHLLAHWLYGDYTRASELSRLNPGVRNPNFVASGQELYGYAK